MKKIIPVIVIVCLFLTMQVSAEVQSLKPLTQNRCGGLPQSFYNSTFQNISAIQLPDKSFLIINDSMQSLGGGLYNYTFCNTSQLGGYIVNGYGDVDGVIQSWSFDFEVTHTGSVQTTSEAISSFAYLVLVIILTITFLYVGFKLTESDVLWVLGIFFMFLSMLFLMYDLWLGYEYQVKYTGAASSAAVPEVLFYLFLASLVMGLLVGGVLLFKRLPEVINWFKINVFNKSEDEWDHNQY